MKKNSKANLIDGRASSDEYEHWLRIQKPVKPDDQLDLTEVELNEEITRQLETENVGWSKNQVIYSFKDFGYAPVTVMPNFIYHKFA